MFALDRAVSAAAIALLAALATPATHAQGELVLELGVPSPLLGGASATHFADHGISDTGDWWALTVASGAATIVINGAVPLATGDVLADGSTFVTARDVRFSDRGDVLVLGTVRPQSTTFADTALIWNGIPIAAEGTDVLGPTGAVVGTIGRFEQVALDGNDRVLARVQLAPYTLGGTEVMVEVPTGNGPQQARLLLGFGVRHPDGAECLDVEFIDVNRRGEVLVAGVERANVLAPVLRTIRVNGATRLRSGDPGPVPGSTWELPYAFGSLFGSTTCSLDDAGEVVLLADLAGAVNGRALARGSRLIAVRNEPLPGTTGPPVQQINNECIVGLPDGRVHWLGYMNGEPAYFIGSERIHEVGSPVAGSTLERVTRFSSSEIDALSGNGGFLLDSVNLADGRRGLLRRALPIGEPGCAQFTPHSGGTTAGLEALGSDVAGGNDLILSARDLPPNVFGLFAMGSGGAVTTSPGSQGLVCLSGNTGRFLTVLDSGAAGRFELEVDTSALPIGAGIAVQRGQTWHFQGWFRDANPGPTSNLTDSVAVTFR